MVLIQSLAHELFLFQCANFSPFSLPLCPPRKRNELPWKGLSSSRVDRRRFSCANQAIVSKSGNNTIYELMPSVSIVGPIGKRKLRTIETCGRGLHPAVNGQWLKR
uniref:Uncharacterized protein n=1 Tax=Micrurus lemniscatus lemniscatus TaxID=129467 RepID=A0A2D4JG78_MICLE